MLAFMILVTFFGVPACADLTITEGEVPLHFSVCAEEATFEGTFCNCLLLASLYRYYPSGLA